MFVAIIIMISFPISKYFKNKLKKFKIIKNNLKEKIYGLVIIILLRSLSSKH